MGAEYGNTYAATHGMSKTAEYRTWCSMVRRARNKNTKDYARYSTLQHDDVLDDFMVFYAEVGDRPSDKHSIDRIDNNLGYMHGNLRWATPSEQRRNNGEKTAVEIKGIVFECAIDASRYFGVTYATVRRWLYGYEYETCGRTIRYRSKEWAKRL